MIFAQLIHSPILPTIRRSTERLLVHDQALNSCPPFNALLVGIPLHTRQQMGLAIDHILQTLKSVSKTRALSKPCGGLSNWNPELLIAARGYFSLHYPVKCFIPWAPRSLVCFAQWNT
jgi:hypothetical protein